MIEFNPNSTRHLQLLFFGGTIDVMTKELILDAAGLPLVFKSGKKEGSLRYKNTAKSVTIKGLGIKALDAWKTEKGNVSIDESVLRQIIQIPKLNADLKKTVELLLEIRQLTKEIGTYYENIEELTYDIDSCVHPSFYHAQTDTGRLSCKSPNLQNQPKSHVLKHFISRYP